MDSRVTQISRTAPLSDAAIMKMARPAERQVYRDTQVNQLVLVCGPRTRTWFLHATVNKHSKRVNLGKFPVVGTADARMAAIEVLRKLWNGEDLTVKQKELPKTLQQALTAYIEARDMKDSSATSCRGVIAVHCAQWLDRPVSSITADALAKHYRSVAAKTPATANKMLRNLSAIVRHHAVSSGEDCGALVARTKLLTGGMEQVAPRDGLIPDSLQGAWFAALSGVPESVRDLLIALALSGCRLNELRGAGAEVWDSGSKTLAVSETKNGRPHRLPVGPFLAALLDRRAEAGDVLFSVTEAQLRGAVTKVSATIGHPWTAHDLRRGLATVLARLGADELVIKRVLNHAAAGVTQKHYLRLEAEDVRAAVQRAEIHLTGLWQVGAEGAAA